MLISIFFIALMFIMAVVAIGMSLLRGIVNLLFGSRTTQQPHSQAGQSHHTHTQSHTQSQQPTSSGGRKRDKIFDKSEGEYVDFEEIKE